MNNKLPTQLRNERGHRIPKITQSMICSAVAESKHKGTGDIANHLELSQTGVLRALKDAEDAGLLTHDVINGNTYVWKVADLIESVQDVKPQTEYDKLISTFKRQSEAVELYVIVLLDPPYNVGAIKELNEAIISRWSKTGLKAIKKAAWERCQGV